MAAGRTNKRDQSGWEDAGPQYGKASRVEVESHDPDQAMLPQSPEVEIAARVGRFEAQTLAAFAVLAARLDRLDGGNVVPIAPAAAARKRDPSAWDVARVAKVEPHMGPIPDATAVPPPSSAAATTTTVAPAPDASAVAVRADAHELPTEAPPWWPEGASWPPRFAVGLT